MVSFLPLLVGILLYASTRRDNIEEVVVLPSSRIRTAETSSTKASTEKLQVTNVGCSNTSGCDETSNTTGSVAYYVHARRDRSGQHLLAFYHLDAYAFLNKGFVGGQCLLDADAGNMRIQKHIQDSKRLISFLGLSESFQYTCPEKAELEAGKAVVIRGKQMRPSELYFTDAWRADLLRRAKFTNTEKKQGPARLDERPHVALHIRRGDISPCNKWDWHYLPNSYYFQLIDDYLPQYCGEDVGLGCQVTVYSEAKSVESFDAFKARGFHLRLSGPLEEVWGGIMNADVAILSISSFSFIPAVLNKNGVILYPPHMTLDMSLIPGWVEIPESYWEEAELQKNQLKQDSCGNT